MIFGDEVNFGSYLYIIFYGNATLVEEGAGMIDKYIFAYLNEATKIGVERNKYSRTLIQFRTDDYTQSFTYLVNVGGNIEFGGQFNCASNNFPHLRILQVI